MHADARRRGDAQIAVRLFAAVGQFDPRRLELHEHVVRGAIEELALLGENEAAGVAVKQRHRQLLLQCADLPRHRRLRQRQLLAGMGETAGLGGGMKDFQLIPIHLITFSLSPRAGRGWGVRGPLRWAQTLRKGPLIRRASRDDFSPHGGEK